MLKSVRIACVLALCVTTAYAKPNVVFVITDDQGYGDLACHGNPILETPTLIYSPLAAVMALGAIALALTAE